MKPQIEEERNNSRRIWSKTMVTSFSVNDDAIESKTYLACQLERRQVVSCCCCGNRITIRVDSSGEAAEEFRMVDGVHKLMRSI